MKVSFFCIYSYCFFCLNDLYEVFWLFSECLKCFKVLEKKIIGDFLRGKGVLDIWFFIFLNIWSYMYGVYFFKFDYE